MAGVEKAVMAHDVEDSAITMEASAEAAFLLRIMVARDKRGTIGVRIFVSTTYDGLAGGGGHLYLQLLRLAADVMCAVDLSPYRWEPSTIKVLNNRP